MALQLGKSLVNGAEIRTLQRKCSSSNVMPRSPKILSGLPIFITVTRMVDGQDIKGVLKIDQAQNAASNGSSVTSHEYQLATESQRTIFWRSWNARLMDRNGTVAHNA